MRRVAIIGGGISGLSAAFNLDTARRAGAQIEYTVFERAPQLGGVIQTERHNDFIIEAGPDSFLTAKPWAAELARELGIGAELIGSNDAKRKTYILLNGRLVPMPDGFQMMVPTRILPVVFSPLFSWATKSRMLREYFLPPSPLAAGEDESVASFVDRHFGREVTENLVSPLVAGVYGGTAERLSARAVLPRFMEMESTYGSLVRGALKSALPNHSPAKGPIFTTFKSGMRTLIDAIVHRLDESRIRTGSCVQRIEKSSEDWRVYLEEGQSAIFDHVILAVPAYAAANPLRTLDAELANRLDWLPYTSSVTVAVAYKKASLEAADVNIPFGFGFLVPQSQQIPIIACTFVHNKFDHRVPRDSVLFRVFLTEAIEWTDERIRAVVTSQLASILKITVQPEEMRIFRWPRSMAQYEVGHSQRVSNIEELAARHKGLHLIGNAYHGIGVPDCVREGKEAAAMVLQSMRV